ncbi:hypothetical protein HDU97_008298 [Phlyctochytrium planicorne]|nr:hypothetical protein HDU97_008298 [Phlyctochytrium planicorne]
MTQDQSVDFLETEKFLDRRLQDVAFLGRTANEVSTIAAASARTFLGILRSLAAAKRKLKKFQETRASSSTPYNSTPESGSPLITPEGSSIALETPPGRLLSETADRDVSANALQHRKSVSAEAPYYSENVLSKPSGSLLDDNEPGSSSEVINTVNVTASVGSMLDIPSTQADDSSKDRRGSLPILSPRSIRVNTSTKLPPDQEDDASMSVDDLRSHKNFLQTNVNALIMENNSLLDRIRELEAAGLAFQNERNSSQSHIDHLEKSLLDLQQQLQGHFSEKEESEFKYQTLKTEYDALSSRLEKSTDSSSLDEVKATIESLQAEKEALAADCVQKVVELEASRQRCSDLEAQLKSNMPSVDFSEKIRELEETITTLKEEKTALELQASQPGKEPNNVTVKLEELRSKNEVLRLVMKKKSEEIFDLRGKLENVAPNVPVEVSKELGSGNEEELQKLKDENALLSSKLESTSMDLAELKDSFDSTTRTNADLFQKIDSLENQLNVLKTSVEDEKRYLLAELESAKQRESDLVSKVHALEENGSPKTPAEPSQTSDELSKDAELKRLSDEAQTLKTANASLQIEKSELSQSHSILSLEIEALRVEVESLKTEKKDFELEISDLNASISNLTAEASLLQSKSGEEQSKLSEEFGKISQEKAALEESHSAFVSQAKEALFNLQKDKDLLLEENDKLKAAGTSVFNDRQRLEEENESLLNEIDTLQAANEELKAANSHLTELNESQKEEVEKLSLQVERMREAGAAVLEIKLKLEVEREELITQNTSLREAGATVVKDREKLEEEADSLAAQLDELLVERDNLLQLKADTDRQLEELGEKLKREEVVAKTSKEEVLRLQDRLTGDVQELVDSLRNITEQNADLKSDIKQLNLEKESLERELANVNQALSDNATALDSLRSQLESEREALKEIQEKLRDSERLKDEAITLAQTERADLQRRFEDLEVLYSASLHRVGSQSNLEGEVENARVEIAALHAQLSESEARYEDLFEAGEKHTIDLESRLYSCESERQVLEDALAAASTRNQHLEEEIRLLSEDVRRREAEVSALEIAKLDAQHQAENLAFEYGEQEKTFRENSDALEQMKKELEYLREHLANEEYEKQNILSDYEKIKSDKTEVYDRLAEALAQATALEASSNESKAAAEEAFRMLEESRQTSDAQKGLIDELTLKAKSLESELEEAQISLQKKDRYIDEIRNSVNDGESRFKYLEDELAELSEKRSQLEKVLLSRETMIADLEKRIDEMSEEISSWQEHSKTLSREKEELVKASESLREEVHRQESSYSSELDEVYGKLKAVNERYSRLEGENDELRSRFGAIVAENEDARLRLSEMSEDYSNLEARFEGQLQQIRDMEQDFDQRNIDFEAFLERSEMQSKALSDQLSAALSEKNNLQKRLASVEEDGQRHLESLKEKLDSIGSERTQEIEVRERRIKELESEMGRMAETIDTMDKDIMSKDQELEELHEKTMKEKISAERQINELKDQLIDLESELGSLSNERSSVRIELTSLNNRKSELEEEVKASNEKMKSLELELSKAFESSKKSQEQSLGLQKKSKELDSLMLEIRGQLDEAIDLVEKKDREIDRLKTLNGHLEEENKQTKSWIQNESARLRSSSDSHHAEAELLRSEIGLISSQLEEARLHLYQREVDVNNLNADYRNEQDRANTLQLELAEVKAKLGQRDSVAVKMKRELQRAGVDINFDTSSTSLDLDILTSNDIAKLDDWDNFGVSRNEEKTSHGNVAGGQNMIDLKQRLSILTNERDELLIETQNRQSAIQKLTDKIVALENELRQVNATLADVTHSRSTIQRELAEARGKFANVQKSSASDPSATFDNELLRRQLEDSKVVIDSLEDQLGKIRGTKSGSEGSRPRPAGLQTADLLFGGSESDSNAQSHDRAVFSSPLSPSKQSSLQREIDLLKKELALKHEEVESIHEDYRQLLSAAEDKVKAYAKLSDSSVQSMELYRNELQAKKEKLEEVQREYQRIQIQGVKGGMATHTPDMSLVDLSGMNEAIQKAGLTAKTLDELVQSAASKKKESLPDFCCGHVVCHKQCVVNGPSKSNEPAPEGLGMLADQISRLVKTTENNINVSNRIYDELTSRGRTEKFSELRSPESALAKAEKSNRDGGDLLNIMKSQTDILEEHKKLLSDIESVSNWFKGQRRESSGRESPFHNIHIENVADGLKIMPRIIAALSDYSRSVSNILELKQVVASGLQGDIQGEGIRAPLLNLLDKLREVEHNQKSLSQMGADLALLLSDSKPNNTDQDIERDYTLTSREYAELVTKSALVDNYSHQVETAHTLLEEHVREVQTLKDAIEALSNQLGERINPSEASSSSVRLLQRQVEELKKVWSHELAANMILRNLIAKTQAENMAAEDTSRQQQIRLREEFDELAAVVEETHREAAMYREECIVKDRALKEVERKLEERLNGQFFDLEQQHQEQAQQLEDMYNKERLALNKLIANLEKERDRLQTELARVKSSFNERLASSTESIDELSHRIQDLERGRDDLKRQNSSLREDLRRSQEDLDQARYSLATLQNTLREKEGTDVAEIIRADFKSRMASLERHIDSLEYEKRNLEVQLQNSRMILDERNSLRKKLADIEQSFGGRLDKRGVAEELQQLERRLSGREMELQEERKMAERRYQEWLEERRILEEELARYRDGRYGDGGQDRVEQASRIFRAQRDNLERAVAQRDTQIRTLEVRLQELLQEGDMIPAEVRRREAALDKDLQLRTGQVHELSERLAMLDEAKRVAEAQYAHEKEKCRRLNLRLDDMKRRLAQDEAVNTALRPTTRSSNYEDRLREEIQQLRKELHRARQSTTEIVAVVKETLQQTIGKPGDQADSPNRPPRIDIARLREQMGSLISEVIYLRAFVNRLLLWRADLKYQKVYLSIKVDDLLSSQKSTLAFIQDMGINPPQSGAPIKLSAASRFRKCANAIIAVYRMMVMARNWQDVLQENGREYFAELESNSDNWPTDGEGWAPRRVEESDSSVRDPELSMMNRKLAKMESEMARLRVVNAQLEDKVMERDREKMKMQNDPSFGDRYREAENRRGSNNSERSNRSETEYRKVMAPVTGISPNQPDPRWAAPQSAGRNLRGHQQAPAAGQNGRFAGRQ